MAMRIMKKFRDTVNKCNHLEIIVMRNKDNPNKYLEIHASDCHHRTVRQFMCWRNEKTNMEVVNYTGDRKLHRWKNKDLYPLMQDYKIYGVIKKGIN